ncbi:unnamed protein product [Candidula unifasciata]|uniref:G-protein coupled receptors family 2 profile 2 domain-containing protein n=1 Tax=Candidula unifasciata TaxID=100452 RepID=A0A8S3YS49_9EUPU|nr:unnamed protein product [Candidula unifasciata]
MSLSSKIIIPKAAEFWNTSTEQTNDETVLKQHSFVWYYLQGVIIAERTQGRDDFENDIIKHLIIDKFNIQFDGNTSLRFTAVVIQKNQKDLFDDYNLRKNNLTFLKSDLETVTALDIGASMTHSIYMSPELSCPFVSFNKSDYVIDVNNDVFPPKMIITLKFQRGKLEFRDTDKLIYLSVDDKENLQVCKQILDGKCSHLTSFIVVRDTALFRALQILTIVCIGLSMLFLVLTLLTYILLLELRNSAGVNIICLCCSLLFAQASLIVASQIRETGYFCTASAITIHYLWLKVFCWCFSCSYNMFRVFTAKTRSARSSSRSKKELLIKIFFCLITPALVVSGVIVGNLLSSGYKRTGYGHTFCSLDSLLLMYFTLLLPIMGILLSNFLFYIISVIEIYNARKLQTPDLLSKQELSKNIFIYLKLSTVTGTFWILTVITEATNINALRVIAILMNGLQGVFIFVSFVCNKRVLKMYKQKIGF